MADRLRDKVVFLTGAGSIGPGWGNGKAAAVAFAREGAKVYALDRSAAASEKTAQIIRDDGGAVDTGVRDVSRGDQVEQSVADAMTAFSRDVALNYGPKGMRCNSILPGLMNTPGMWPFV